MIRSFTVAVLFAAAICAAEPAKKILTHADQDNWATASGTTISPDGLYLAYIVATPNRDGSIVLRNVPAGTDVKIATGSRPAPAPGAPPGSGEGEEDQLPATPTAPPTPPAPTLTGTPTFTPDSKFLYAPLLPTKAEVQKAKDDKLPPEKQPKPILAVIDVKTGQITQRIEGVLSYRLLGEGAGILVLTMQAKPEAPADEPKPAEPKPMGPKPDADQHPGRPGTAPTPRMTYGTELIVKDMATQKQTSFADVQESSITRDLKTIVFTVNAKKAETNGLFAANLLDAATAKPIKSGLGRYYRVAWNEAQTQLAFFFDEKPTTPPSPPSVDPANPAPAPLPDPDALSRKPRVYLWERGTKDGEVSAAVELLGPSTAGLKANWQIVDRGGLSFSADGKKLIVNAAPIPQPPPASVAPPAPGDEQPANPNFDMNLWHWKDEAIQPMQKMRAGLDKNKSYRCVYFFDTKQFVHLADEERNVAVPAFGDWGLGSSDKPYRAQTWNYPNPVDYSIINIRSAESKPLVAANSAAPSASPKNAAAAWFDGKDWFLARIPDGKPKNITTSLVVKFFNEEYDMPSTPGSYGLTGWSSDEKYLFINDRYDIWRVAVETGEVKNITEVGRASGIRLRLIRVEMPDDEKQDETIDRGLDTSKSWLLSAENLKTRDTGIYRLPPAGKLQLLTMASRKFGTPIKAKKAEVQLLTLQTFGEFPDYYTSGTDFKELKRQTEINPHIKDYNWGRAELVDFKSSDGAPLQGLLVKPEDFDPSKKYPMIVYIYERLTDTLHSFRAPTVTRGQVINPTYYVSNGYLVFMPDIAYKNGQPGQSALKCILPGIQTLVDKGFVDEKAIGINGQSWGGYQIAYLVTQSDRFKAAVAGAPVSNMVSAYNGIRWGTGLPRQFQYEKSQSRLGRTLWEAPFKYLENSPVFMADRVTTPLMMIHNDNDDAVPWYQSIEYFLALRRLNKEAYLLNYNGQPHNLSNRTAARDFAVRMQQFFDHHLKGAKMPAWMEKGVPFLEREPEKEGVKKLWDGGK